PSARPPPTLWPRREVIAEAYEFRRPSELTLHLECKISFRGRGDEKASGDRVFCHFIDGRSVLRRRLAADGTAGLPFGPCHARRMDRHLFWSQRRLRLGAGLIKYRFCRCTEPYPCAGAGRAGRIG